MGNTVPVTTWYL